MSELLAEPAHREERVVDRERQADHGRHVRHEDAHLGDAGEQADDRHRARQGERDDEDRQHRADDRAEDGEQDQHRDRQADHLGLHEILLDRLVELLLDDRDAGHDRLDTLGRLDEAGEVLRVLDGILEVLVEPDEREGLRAVTAQERGVANVGVGEDLVDVRLVRERRHAFGHGRLELGGIRRAVGVREHDDHARRLLAEPVGEERLGARALGAGNLPASLAELSTRIGGPDVETDDESESREWQPAPPPIGRSPQRGEDPVVRDPIIHVAIGGRQRGRKGLGKVAGATYRAPPARARR